MSLRSKYKIREACIDCPFKASHTGELMVAVYFLAMKDQRNVFHNIIPEIFGDDIVDGKKIKCKHLDRQIANLSDTNKSVEELADMYFANKVQNQQKLR